MKFAKYLTAFSVFSVIAGVTLPAQGILFNLNPTFDTTTPEGQKALDGFQSAANLWSNEFNDNVTVNLDIGFASLGGSTLGQASSTREAVLVSDFANALSLDITSTNDQTAVNNLPLNSTTSGTDFIVFRGTEENGTTEFDTFNTGTLTNDNTSLAITQANAKAVGLAQNNGTADGEITFNSDFNFDFDRSNGIDSNKFDFTGIATHEIGHTLGFISGVDTVDFNSQPNGPNAPTDLDNFAIFNSLDLFRYSTDSLALGSNVLDLAVGGDPFFSIDGGSTNLADFSTGAFNGNGDQASHWLDNQGLGLMDPTFARGELGQISDIDRVAFDSIGYDTQPVPFEAEGTMGLVALGGFFGYRYLKNRKKRNQALS